MSSNSPISRFENFARHLVEGSFDRLLGQPGPLMDVASQVAAEAERNQHGGLTANHYVVSVHPYLLAELGRQTSDAQIILKGMLERLGEQNGLVFAGDVYIEFESDPAVALGDAKVSASFSREEGEPTAVLSRERGSTAPLGMTEAYLIVNGRRHVVLEKAVITIGRSLDSEIILEDQGVSRTHAQIRWRNGHFEIFDLGSKAGTLVNGRKVTSSRLRSGDVVTLGTAAVIYGEEESAKNIRTDRTGRSAEVTQELMADDPL